MRKNLSLILSLIFILSLGISGCARPTPAQPSDVELTMAALLAEATVTQLAVQTQIAAAQTQQAVPSLTPTSIIPTDTPTATVAPIINQTPSELRVSFAAGATRWSLSESIPANTLRRYTLNAGKDQMLDLYFQAVEGYTISLRAQNGAVLLSPTANAGGFRVVLPATQDYYIDVQAGAVATNFNITVTIPVTVKFASGENNISYSQKYSPNAYFDYIVYAAAGQTLTVTTSPGTDLNLTIFGYDGTVLKSSMGEGSSWSGVLPVTQYYFITILSLANPSANVTTTIAIK